MSSNKAKRHVHKYFKLDMNGTKVWACAQPDCNHYMPAHMSGMVPGKNSICWKCGDTMILHSINMKDEKPKCDDCMSILSDDGSISSDELSSYLNEKLN